MEVIWACFAQWLCPGDNHTDKVPASPGKDQTMNSYGCVWYRVRPFSANQRRDGWMDVLSVCTSLAGTAKGQKVTDPRAREGCEPPCRC